MANPKSGTPWEQDTLVNVFSSTKGVVALAVNQLIDRGFIDIAEPVSKYWPEFTGGGKELLTVEQLLSHQAGLMNGATLDHMLAGFDTATAALLPMWVNQIPLVVVRDLLIFFFRGYIVFIVRVRVRIGCGFVVHARPPLIHLASRWVCADQRIYLFKFPF